MDSEARGAQPAGEHALQREPPPSPPASPPPPPPPPAPPVAAQPPPRPWRKWVLLALVVVGLAVAVYFLLPIVITMLNTVSTDDAYVNGHVTFLAARVAGQVSKVRVDDNYRVKRGDVLVQLDREPYLVQLDIKKAAVKAAEADLVAANAQVRALAAQTHGYYYRLMHSIEDVNTQIANLRANVAVWKSKVAALVLAKDNLVRGEKLAPKGGISKEDLDVRRETAKVAEAVVEQTLQTVISIRVGLGLPARAIALKEVLANIDKIDAVARDFTEVPPNLDQNYSVVRQTLGELLNSAAQLAIVPSSLNATPKEVVANFYRRDAEGVFQNSVNGYVTILLQNQPLAAAACSSYFVEPPRGDLDRIYGKILRDAPQIQQAKAKLLQARSDLEQAKLNLRYCDVVSDIDGVVTRRNVNQGNNVAVGQSLMAIRSLTEIWIDANFKETQLAYLRIGQRVRCEVDMYGSHKEFEGRITGFTMGTGQTLALLPPQNATGNFVKIVQRLPVRIELTDYDPDKLPLFVGLSVEPYVYYKEPAEGPNAGKFLQPPYLLPRAPVDPKP